MSYPKATSASVPFIKLSSGHSIPQVGLGVYLTGTDVAAKVVKEGLEVGYRHVDSAAIYGNESEAAQGILEFLSENPAIKRSDIFFTTKVWEADHGYDEAKAAIAKSLERIGGLGYIDLLLIHSPRAPITVDEKADEATQLAAKREKRLGTWRAFQEAVDQGIVKSIGVSNYGVAHLEELLAWDGLRIKPVVNQIELHPWLQRTELVEFGRKHGILPEAYSPLTRGQKLKDPIDKDLVALAQKYKRSPAQILIRWSVQQGFITLPKSVHIDRLVENFDIWDFELTEEDANSIGGKELYGITGWDPTVAL
ncbi:uncharacterized protein SAPINGB_P003483 [Magnusiomyces paraingens]|uniref:NADP-dependent oxidoreductase domain-containing protein n=1 Tax=Magnusiomyces paraingens TaxID=2606893 RepID=A0A5E8BRX7_9ASCO|nr:uncharacterized protein SAPINGB_P003483 [Saprochaete ingens]VVT53259.1 unnamed protein product [Saprochaete ingens]